MKKAGKVTLTAREVKFATMLVLPGQLATHGNSMGLKAINDFYTKKPSV